MEKLYTFIIASLLSMSTFAQSPDMMSYQAIVRDAADNLIVSSSVGMKISILQGSTSGTIVYSETQTPTSNQNGLVSIEIGAGTIVLGNFSAISWGNGPFFIKTETDPTGGANYTITGTSQLLSVPYAFHANIADSIIGGASPIETDPIFGASVASGITAQDTANWNIDNNTQLDSADIAALGFVAGPHTDSVQIANIAWGLNGNSNTDDETQFIGTTDSAALNFRVNNVQSGFIGSTQSSTSFGYLSLSAVPTGSYNTGIGYEALKNTTGTENTAVGYHALKDNDTAIHNTAIGNEALLSNTASANTAVGNRALRQNTSGINLVAVGAGALQSNTLGNSNTSIGQSALINNLNGSDNTAIGNSALSINTTGQKNIAIGSNADVLSNNLTNAIAIGYNAKVGISNAMVLGGVGADAVKVGIGTSSPARSLHVNDVMRLEPISTPPANPSEGDIYMNSGSHKLMVFDGNVWQACW